MGPGRAPVSAEDAALRLLLEMLDRLGIEYFVGGSVASASHGLARSTIDVDVIARIQPSHAEPLAAALGSDFYLDAEAAADSISRGRSFNIIHKPTAYKFDVFPALDDAYHLGQFERARDRRLATAEDILLEKLLWYRAGGEVSERQWNDVRGIRDVQGERLDRGYLARWAEYLGVADLLDRLMTERE